MVKYLYFSEIDSTNTFLIHNVNTLDTDTVVFADEQKFGKGRNGRVWISPKTEKYQTEQISINNLYCSILLKLIFEDETKKLNVLKNIAHYTAVVVCRILALYGINAKIKWPNDILVDGKKISGILCESSIQGNEIALVVGCGVNLNMTEEFFEKIDQVATSLNILCSQDIDRDEFLTKFIDEFFSGYENFAKTGFKYIEDEYKKKSLILEENYKKRIKVDIFGKTVVGYVKDIDSEGQLILIDDDNKQQIINVGDVFF